jgi:hypothetical protein
LGKKHVLRVYFSDSESFFSDSWAGGSFGWVGFFTETGCDSVKIIWASSIEFLQPDEPQKNELPRNDDFATLRMKNVGTAPHITWYFVNHILNTSQITLSQGM